MITRSLSKQDYDHVVQVIDRWWGGTHLTNDKLWRWDAEAGRLVGA